MAREESAEAATRLHDGPAPDRPGQLDVDEVMTALCADLVSRDRGTRWVSGRGPRRTRMATAATCRLRPVDSLTHADTSADSTGDRADTGDDHVPA